MLNVSPMPFEDWYAMVPRDFIREILGLVPDDPIPSDDVGDDCHSCGGEGTIDIEHSWVDPQGKTHSHTYEVICCYCGGNGCLDSREILLMKRVYEEHKRRDLENLRRYQATGTI